jgi:hypothetical protein
VDPHYVNENRDSNYDQLSPDADADFYFDADPDPTFHPDADPDPYPTFHPDADPDPYSTFHPVWIRIRVQILASKEGLKPLKKCSNRLIFHTFWLVICKLMRIRMRIRIQLIIMMRIRILIFI